jgi:hypothetical protein
VSYRTLGSPEPAPASPEPEGDANPLAPLLSQRGFVRVPTHDVRQYVQTTLIVLAVGFSAGVGIGAVFGNILGERKATDIGKVFRNSRRRTSRRRRRSRRPTRRNPRDVPPQGPLVAFYEIVGPYSSPRRGEHTWRVNLQLRQPSAVIYEGNSESEAIDAAAGLAENLVRTGQLQSASVRHSEGETAPRLFGSAPKKITKTAAKKRPVEIRNDGVLTIFRRRGPSLDTSGRKPRPEWIVTFDMLMPNLVVPRYRAPRGSATSTVDTLDEAKAAALGDATTLLRDGTVQGAVIFDADKRVPTATIGRVPEKIRQAYGIAKNAGKRRTSARHRSRGRPAGGVAHEPGMTVTIDRKRYDVDLIKGSVMLGDRRMGSVYDLSTSFRAIPVRGEARGFGTLAGAIKHVLRHSEAT